MQVASRAFFLKKYPAVVSLQTESHVSSKPTGAKSLVKDKLQEWRFHKMTRTQQETVVLLWKYSMERYSQGLAGWV